MIIREGGLDEAQVQALLALHLAESRASTPQDNAHALGSEGFGDPADTFWSAWDGEALAGFAACASWTRATAR